MEIEILKFADRKHTVTFSIPLRKLKIHYNKVVLWAENILKYISKCRFHDPSEIVFEKIFSVLKILDHSVLAKFVPAFFLVANFHERWPYSRQMVHKAIQLCGKIGDRKLCCFAFGKTWHLDFRVAKQIWKFSKFTTKDIDENLVVKIDGKRYISGGLYELFIPQPYSAEYMKIFTWKIENLKPTVDEMRKIEEYLSDIISRTHHDFRKNFTEHHMLIELRKHLNETKKSTCVLS